MRLYLLRHGIAEQQAPRGDDRARRLTAAGRARMRAEAAGIHALGLTFSVILTSPLARATQTAAIVAAALPRSPEPRVLPALATGVPVAEAFQALRPFLRRNHVLVVGHEPALSRLAALCLTGSSDGLSLRMNKGTLVALDVPATRLRTGAQLRWILTPRQLRRLAR